MIETLLQLDGNILLFIQEYIRNPILDPLMIGITHLGDAGIFWILLTAVLLLFKKTRQAGLVSALALVFSLVINNLWLKNMVARTRPYEVMDSLRLMIEQQHDFSFPSGHSGASFASAFACWKMLPRKWGIACLILAVLIAVSRLYVGVHYPSDVLGGIATGIFCGFLAWKVNEFLIRKKMGKGID